MQKLQADINNTFINLNLSNNIEEPMCADCSIIKTDDIESYKTENHEMVHSQNIRGTNVDTVVDEPEVPQDHVPQPFKFNFVSDPGFMRDIFIDIHVNDDEFLYDDGTKCKIELAKVLHTHEDDHLEANQPTLLLSRPQNNLICCKNMRFDVQDPLAFQAGQRTNVVVDKQDFPWRMEHVTPPVSETVSWIDVHEPSYVWLPNFVLSSPSECSVADKSDVSSTSPYSCPLPQPQTIMSVPSEHSQVVQWTVDSHKLQSECRQVVSPPFKLSYGTDQQNSTFKLILVPKVFGSSRGRASFKKVQGKGYVELKCQTELTEPVGNMRFQISIGSGHLFNPPRTSAPVQHNFTERALCSLTCEQEELDFSEVEDRESKTFTVRLEVLSFVGCHAPADGNAQNSDGECPV